MPDHGIVHSGRRPHTLDPLHWKTLSTFRAIRRALLQEAHIVGGAGGGPLVLCLLAALIAELRLSRHRSSKALLQLPWQRGQLSLLLAALAAIVPAGQAFDCTPTRIFAPIATTRTALPRDKVGRLSEGLGSGADRIWSCDKSASGQEDHHKVDVDRSARRNRRLWHGLCFAREIYRTLIRRAENRPIVR